MILSVNVQPCYCRNICRLQSTPKTINVAVNTCRTRQSKSVGKLLSTMLAIRFFLLAALVTPAFTFMFSQSRLQGGNPRLSRTLSMKLQTGIVGLPNVGKSTLFNALVGSETAQAANFPFCTIGK